MLVEFRIGKRKGRKAGCFQGDRFGDLVVLSPADGYPNGAPSRSERLLQRRPDAVGEHLPGAIRTGSVEHLVADVLQGDDVLGDGARVFLGDLGLAFDEQALTPRHPLVGVYRFENHGDTEVVDDVPDDDAAKRQHDPRCPPMVRYRVQDGHEHEAHRVAEVETEVLHELQFFVPHGPEDVVE
ncbi:Uncharacterised protein [Mycobacteroides abscessus subsp. abscessus]|nr:Uncharacterised protein [Mycobacteroides abscessus subsp. abscessus]